MPAPLTPEDLRESLPNVSLTRLQEMIDDAYAMALTVAPGLGSATFTKHDALKAVLRRAIAYEYQSSEAVAAQTVGPASVTYHRAAPSSVTFSPAQEARLRELARGPALGGFYFVPMGG